jgi:hypothetical protein
LHRPSQQKIAGYMRSLVRPEELDPERIPAQTHPADALTAEPPSSSPEPPDPDEGGGRIQHRLADDYVTEPAQPGTTRPAASELRPPGLKLYPYEASNLLKFAALLPTPRAAKKMMNLYRVYRIGISWDSLQDFVGDSETPAPPYLTVQFLLAILVGFPADAGDIFRALLHARPDEQATAVLHGHTTISSFLAPGTRLLGLPELAGGYQPYCLEVARYSFHTMDLSNSEAP